MLNIIPSINVDPPQHNSIAKDDDSATSNYWRQQDATILQKLKIVHQGQIFQLPDNTNINAN